MIVCLEQKQKQEEHTEEQDE